MRIVLTGATGFLGSRLLPLLADHDVLCLSREPGAVLRQPRARAIRADLGRDREWAGEIAAFRPEWCLHLAWEGLPDYSLGRCRANLDASLRLLDVLAQAGLQRMVVAGSCWEYGRASGALREDQAPVDAGVFAAAKLALLAMVDSVARQAAFEYRWARIFFVYGPGQRPQSLLPHLRAAYAAGRTPDLREPAAVQDFVHVDDVAAALQMLVTAPGPSGVFNVGSGVPTSVAAVAAGAADYYGRPRTFEAGAAGSGCWADITKLRTVTGWRPRIVIADGLASTLAALDAAT